MTTKLVNAPNPRLTPRRPSVGRRWCSRTNLEKNRRILEKVMNGEDYSDEIREYTGVVARGLITGIMQCPCFASGACEAVR